MRRSRIAAIIGLALIGATPALADPVVYHLGNGATVTGTEFSLSSNGATFSIPSVAEGILFYNFDLDNLPQTITLLRLYPSHDKVVCSPISHVVFSCSDEAADSDGWTNHDSIGSLEGDIITANTFTTILQDSPQQQVAAADPPASIPEPGTLILLVSALIGLAAAKRCRHTLQPRKTAF